MFVGQIISYKTSKMDPTHGPCWEKSGRQHSFSDLCWGEVYNASQINSKKLSWCHSRMFPPTFVLVRLASAGQFSQTNMKDCWWNSLMKLTFVQIKPPFLGDNIYIYIYGCILIYKYKFVWIHMIVCRYTYAPTSSHLTKIANKKISEVIQPCHSRSSMRHPKPDPVPPPQAL